MVMVSIICATFNQEAYIAQALDSFLMQKTDFEFEVLVHDDASTDATASIVREYERQYPSIVKPVYQAQNQYSQGVKITPLTCARAQGKYVALCEGDDYWIDPLKLQKQVDAMEGDAEFSLCVHSSLKVSPDGAPIGEVRPAREDRTFSLAEIVVENPGFFLTSSLLFPTSYSSVLPEYYFRCPVGDWPLILFLASKGQVRYLDRQMSAYRVNAVNSWTRSHAQSRSMQKRVALGLKEMLISFDESTGFAHTHSVRNSIEQYDFRIALLEGRFGEVKSDRFSRYYHRLAWRSRFVISMRQRSPRLVDYLTKAAHTVGRLLGGR